ncbi:unnamed protein product [Brugia timori]|uniref:Minor tail protein n=1 Tax=Brugia timori TaxID=42155 RepID=A0A0R3Q2Y9_9BILA|nr:unnamed protein product [Brugia timori]
MFRDSNRLINGDMRIDQRNNGGSVTVTSGSPYTVDRWTAGMSGANGTAQRVASGLLGIPNALQITGAAGTTTAWVGQKIEAQNAAQLVGQYVTVSFWASSSNQSGLTMNLKYANSADNFGAMTLIESRSTAVTSTLTRYTLTTSVVIPAGAANGLYLELATQGNLSTGNVILTGVQLETGVTAGAYQPRSYGSELILCQRYYEKSGANVGATWTANDGTASGGSHPTANYRALIQFRVTKRAAPTFTPYDQTGAAGKISYYVASWNDAGTLAVSAATTAGAYVGHNVASPAGEALAKAQVDIGRLETEVSHLTDAVKELRASNAAVTKALVDIQRTLDEARGGWRTLMFVGGAAASMGGGNAFRLIFGEIVAYLNKKQDHQLELERLKIQDDIESAQHVRTMESLKLQNDLGIKVIQVQRDADLDRIDGTAWSQAVADVGKQTGILFLDYWNGSVRPLLATLAILVVVAEVVRNGFILSDWDKELVGAILGIYVADRSLARRGK